MEHYFDNREQASIAAAERITRALERRLELGGKASLVVSGGTTPGRCFQELAGTAIDWSHVSILASDERWVPPDHEDSNERLIRETLMVEAAAAADLLPFFAADTDIDTRCETLHDEILRRPFPFACALLGIDRIGEHDWYDEGARQLLRRAHPPAREDQHELEAHQLMNCFECASCSFVCPSRIPLVQWMRMGKGMLRNRKESS